MKPNENNIDMWIKSKYEGKKWAMKGPIPDPSTLGGGSNSSVAQPQVKSPKVTSKATPKEPVKTTVKPKQTEFSSLDDFFGSSPSNSTPTSTTTNNNAAVTQLQGADFFHHLHLPPLIIITLIMLQKNHQNNNLILNHPFYPFITNNPQLLSPQP
ncbi:unnamed protein product [Cunninghamella echinulata]